MECGEKLLNSETVFAGKVLRMSLDTVSLPNGNQAQREVVHHPGAACVLAETDDKKLVLVRQYRHACGLFLLEIPAGKLDSPSENPCDCALRELAEETPYTAQSVDLIYVFYTCAGFCNEKMFLFQASGLQKNSCLSADEDEFVQTVLLDRQEVETALTQGQIQDAKTLIALQFWLNKTGE